MAHQGAMGQGCSLRERLQGFLPAESGFDAAHAALPRRSLPPAPSFMEAREGAGGRLWHSSPQPTLLFLPSGSCGNTVLAGNGKACPVQRAVLPPPTVHAALQSCCTGGLCPLPNPSPQPVSALGGQDPSGEERGRGGRARAEVSSRGFCPSPAADSQHGVVSQWPFPSLD